MFMSNKLGELNSETLIKTLPDKGAEGQVDTLASKGGTHDTKQNLRNVKTETLVDALADSVAKVETKKLCDRVVKVKFLALFDALADWPTKLVHQTLREHRQK